MDVISKYVKAILAVGWVVSLVVVGWAAHHIGSTDVKLDTTTQSLKDSNQFLADYQTLVKDRDSLRIKYDAATSQRDQLLQEKLNGQQTATLQLIGTLRDPARSVYADANCGEAGNYPTVFGTRLDNTGPTQTTGLSGPDAAVRSKQ